MYRIMFIHLLLILKTLSKVKMDALLLQEKLKNDFTLNIIFHISNKNVPFTYTCIDLYFIYIFNVISQFQDFYLCIFIYTQLHVHVSANMNLLNISSYMHILKTLITTNNQGTMHFWIFFVICNALFMHLNSKCIFAWPSLIKIYNNHSKLMFWIINYCIYWGKCYPYWNSLRVVDFSQNINAWIASCFHHL